MKKILKAGLTDQTIDIFVQDSSSSTGGGLTGLVFNSASLVCYYRRGATGSATALTLATQTVGGAHSDGGFVEISSANMPGMYRLDLSDAIVATGVTTVTMMLKGASNMAPVTIEIQLVSVDLDDAVRFGLTALPNAAAEAAGGLYTRGTGAGQIAQDANGNIRANVDTIKTNPVVNGGTITFPSNATLASTTNITAGTITTTTNLTNLPAAAALEASLQALITTVGVAGAGLTAADDAVLAAIAALENLSEANVRTAVGLASANLDTQLDALPTNAELATALGTADDAVLAQVALVKAKTDNLPAAPAATGDAMALTSGERNSTADAILARSLGTEAVSALGAIPTVAQAFFEMLSLLGEFSIAGTTITCKKRDGSTTLFTSTLDSSTEPTSRARAT